MNKKLLAAAIGVAIAAPAFAQSSNVTLYGRLNTSLENDTSSGSRSATVVRSNQSRLGVKGTEDLGSGLKGVFGIETQLASDSGSGGLGNALRNAYVGLGSTAAGTLAIGRLDVGAPGGAPAYSSYAAVWTDVNHDNGTTGLTQTDGLGTVNGSLPGNRALFGIRTRTSNAISYAAPQFFPGLQVHARYSLNGTDNNNLASNTNTPANPYEQDVREFELAGLYKTGGLSLTGAYTDANIKDTSALFNIVNYRWQLGAGYDFGFVKLGGLFARTNYDRVSAGSRDNASEAGVSLAAPFGPHQLILNYAQRQLQGRESVAAATQGRDRVWQLGYHYNLSARTRAYAFYQNRDANTGSSVEAPAASVSSPLVTATVKTFGVGVRHNF
ncbi:MAG: porin [Burkholderiaceae bacterium]|jgi:predicted porin